MRKEFVLWSFAVVVALVGLGIHAMRQTRCLLRRNFPLVSRGQWVNDKIFPYVSAGCLLNDDIPSRFQQAVEEASVSRFLPETYIVRHEGGYKPVEASLGNPAN